MTQPLNTTGAAHELGCSIRWIQQLVRDGRLKAYAYNDKGELVSREEAHHKQGEGLFFFKEDIEDYKNNRARPRGRPKGSKDTKPRKIADCDEPVIAHTR